MLDNINFSSGVSPLLGAIVGSVIGGPANDFLAKYMSRRNNGIYEPEFRLLSTYFSFERAADQHMFTLLL